MLVSILLVRNFKLVITSLQRAKYSFKNVYKLFNVRALISSKMGDTYMHQWTASSLDLIMASCLFSTKALSAPMMTQCLLVLYVSVTSNHGPGTILSPVRFLAHKAEWSARRNFMLVLFFSRSHQATGPIHFDTAVHLRFGRIIFRIPRVPRAVPVQASYEPHTGIFNLFHIPRDPYGAYAGPARVPYGTLTDM